MLRAGPRPRSGSKLGGIDNTVTLWHTTGQAELDAVAGSGWRAWPVGAEIVAVPDRQRATQIARGQGGGYVTRFQVDRAFVDGRGPELRIAADEMDEFNKHITGAIVEEADYRGPVGDDEFAEAEAALGTPLPAAWREHLQSPSWFRRGWLARSGAYVWLHTPREMLEIHQAWQDSVAAHPGIAIIGGDGSREQLVLDLRRDPAPVRLAGLVSEGWDTTFGQAADVTELIARVEAGTFEFDFGKD
ncbi:SMI1/KNR4 family protein [Actinoplanes sp. TRM 88003]|uniref:SMI1/KNR4 family protein n=1 Tax=Paractinoplanes aksuensis TaxID=2939490 RepID=A0ABT1DFC6_9ACTN|nr:SMI1/KNR4 family protein [Actinoplanes aksuensis]MCO8269527.1 SMI1/KNR4 family protein [Actinoplanes aksuensis]